MLLQPKVRTTKYGLLSMRYDGARLWNNVMASNIYITDINEFRAMLKNHLYTCQCVAVRGNRPQNTSVLITLFYSNNTPTSPWLGISPTSSPWAKSRYLTGQYHQRGPHFNGTNLFRYIYSKYFFLLDIPNW